MTATRKAKHHARYDRAKYFTDHRGMLWRPDGYAFMQPLLAEGSQGDATVTHFTINADEADMYNMRQSFQPGGSVYMIEPGDYVKLRTGDSRGGPTMSDTPMERRTNREFVREAYGRVLVAGLGIGMILHPILNNVTSPHGGVRRTPVPVDHVTVVEKNPNVIALVKPSLERYGDKLTIVESDIFDFTPGKEKFDVAYFDIWPTVNADNLEEIAKLHRRWSSKLRRDGQRPPFMSSWMVDLLRSERAADRAAGGDFHEQAQDSAREVAPEGTSRRDH